MCSSDLYCPQVWQNHLEEGGACLVFMLEEKRECMNVQKKFKSKLSILLGFISFYFQCIYSNSPHQIKNAVYKFNSDIAAFVSWTRLIFFF